ASAVSGVPSWNRTPGRRANVYVRPSLEMSHFWARPGTILYVPSSCPVSPSNIRLVTRAELRSVIWGGSMVTGSAGRPMTIASFGGAADAGRLGARDSRATATSTRRVSMAVLLFGARRDASAVGPLARRPIMEGARSGVKRRAAGPRSGGAGARVEQIA